LIFWYLLRIYYHSSALRFIYYIFPIH
jgi:hypothetical protein